MVLQVPHRPSLKLNVRMGFHRYSTGQSCQLNLQMIFNVSICRQCAIRQNMNGRCDQKWNRKFLYFPFRRDPFEAYKWIRYFPSLGIWTLPHSRLVFDVSPPEFKSVTGLTTDQYLWTLISILRTPDRGSRAGDGYLSHNMTQYSQRILLSSSSGEH